jgi:hypothetical protein
MEEIPMRKAMNNRALLAGLVVGGSLFLQGPVEAQPVDTACKPRNVVVWEAKPHSRVHVQCVAAVGNIKYFAYRSNDADAVARVLTILTAARAAGADLIINYAPADTSGASWGCNSSDCRTIRAVGF